MGEESQESVTGTQELGSRVVVTVMLEVGKTSGERDTLNWALRMSNKWGGQAKEKGQGGERVGALQPRNHQST